MDNIVIATIKSWNIENAQEFSEQCKDYTVHTVFDKDSLDIVHDLKPRYIFFPHWSWIIPKDIWQKFECVAFHMADLPYGRGGSPLQNLIMRKVYQTKISAFRVDDGIDTGPIYLKSPIDISEGSAGDIFRIVSRRIFEDMIPRILREQMQPVPQAGEVLEFKRRTPSQSWLEDLDDGGMVDIYDFIRMLDADGYPKAYQEIAFDGFNKKILLSDAQLEDNKVTGRFEIVRE